MLSMVVNRKVEESKGQLDEAKDVVGGWISSDARR